MTTSIPTNWIKEQSRISITRQNATEVFVSFEHNFISSLALNTWNRIRDKYTCIKIDTDVIASQLLSSVFFFFSKGAQMIINRVTP